MNRVKWLFILFTIVVVCSLVIGSWDKAAVGLTPNEVEGIAEAISVKIISPKIRNPAENELRGTGVIIPSTNSNTYYVLTAQHVASATKETKYWVVTSDTNWHEVTEVRDVPYLDLSWLKFASSANYPRANLGDSSRLEAGDTIYLYGWLRSDDGRAYRFTPGTFRKHLKPGDTLATDGYGMTYDAVVENGMSGGPVLDADGRLVGIHGRAPTKFNYRLGIPINTFLDNSSSRLSWLRLCNNYSFASYIFTAFVRYAGSNRGWESKGWYGIQPDSCRTLPLGEGYVNNVYYYAEADGVTWGQGELFCINKSEAFTIPNSDRDSCKGQNLTRVQMSKISAAPGMVMRNFVN
ncbi:MAG: hypothetical protein Fur0025_35700 [Oscillatoriaceae cyanobacterium]